MLKICCLLTYSYQNCFITKPPPLIINWGTACGWLSTISVYVLKMFIRCLLTCGAQKNSCIKKSNIHLNCIKFYCFCRKKKEMNRATYNNIAIFTAINMWDLSFWALPPNAYLEYYNKFNIHDFALLYRVILNKNID